MCEKYMARAHSEFSKVTQPCQTPFTAFRTVHMELPNLVCEWYTPSDMDKEVFDQVIKIVTRIMYDEGLALCHVTVCHHC